MANQEGRDYGKWVVVALCVAVAASQIYVMQQNHDLKQRVANQSSVTGATKFASTKSDRTAFEASMTGRCEPSWTRGQAPSPTRPLDVSIYFSLNRDCMSCIEDVVGQWNGVMRNEMAKSLVVRGYTDIDGTRAKTTLERDLKPAFPVTDVDEVEQKLAAAGVTTTPVVFVSEPSTGRVLMTYAPLVGEKGDRSLVERLAAVLTPCS
ncbi:MAG TPA: hypothetical protein VE974_17315 [Thermoanaerobaculia bacterium]|nr:hypothetical protein [Thermoanaerobaculia bacterium]